MINNYLFEKHYPISEIESKIIAFRGLPRGWNYGQGVPPSEETINIARALNTDLQRSGFQKTNAFPGIDGEIQITAYHESFYLEFTISVDGKITFVQERDNEELRYEEGLSVADAVNKIRAFWGSLWASSDLSITYTTMTPKKRDLPVLHSETQATGLAYPSLRKNVRNDLAQVFVTTSKDTIQTLRVAPHYSSIFQTGYSLQLVHSFRMKAPAETNAITTLRG